MPLQNRVTPCGEIVAIPQRGLFTGNRGIIHDPATRTLLKRRWTTKAWIVCVCEYKGWRRKPMAGQSWTELFFLDEATALAAGHRPCFFCRREAAKRFRAAWAKGNGVSLLKAAAIDAVLHGERLEGTAKRLHPMPGPISDLPCGAMLWADADCYLKADGGMFRWSPDGYHVVLASPKDPRLLTPPSTVRALAAGYRPVLHPGIDTGMTGDKGELPRG
jgi:hypothetical protein